MKIESKPPESLSGQVDKLKDKIGEAPFPVPDIDTLVRSDLETIKRRFPKRFDLCHDLYLKILRGEKFDEADEAELEQIKESLRILNNLDQYIKTHQKSAQGEQILRPRQFDVLEDMRAFLESGEMRGYVKLPTGVGKTVLFIEFVKALSTRALVVVPTNILVDQTHEKFKQFAPNLKTGRINKDVKEPGEDATIITYSSLVSGFKNGTLNPEDYDCLILDEAHKALGKETSKILEDPRFSGLIQIGFTATPKYAENKQVSNFLAQEIHSMTIQEAVEEGLLSGFRTIVAKTEVDLRNIKIDSNGEYNEKELEEAINTEKRNRSALLLYKKMFMGKKVVIYCNSIKHAQDVAKIFRDDGIKVDAVWGEQRATALGKREQQKTISDLSAGEIDGIANARLLIEGWDDPSVKVCFNLIPTQSLVDAEQRGGRVLRLFGEERATVVDFLDKTKAENFPVTFAEIANATAIPPERSSVVSDREKREKTSDETIDIEIEGLEVLIDPKQIMELVKINIDQKYKVAPANWFSLTEISREMGRIPSTLRYWINQNLGGLGQIEGLSGKYRSPDTGHLGLYFDPSVRTKFLEVAKSFERQSVYQIAPEGWVKAGDCLRDIPNLRKVLFGKRIKYRGHIKRFRSRDEKRTLSIHYSPIFVAALKEEAKKMGERTNLISNPEIEDTLFENVRLVLVNNWGVEESLVKDRLLLVSDRIGKSMYLGEIVREGDKIELLCFSRTTKDNRVTKIIILTKAIMRSLDSVSFQEALKKYEGLDLEQKQKTKPPQPADFMKDSIGINVSLVRK